jgi:hypothetical protein
MPFLSWEDYYKFYLAFRAPFSFGEEDFHKIKGRETLSRSHDLNTTDSNAGWTEFLA